MIENKAFMLDHFEEYGIRTSNTFKYNSEKSRPLTKAEFIGLLNILDAHGENLDSFHDASFNGYGDFCEIVGSFEDDNDTYNALMQFNCFIPEDEFIEWMLEHIQNEVDNYGDYAEAMDFIKEEAFGDACDSDIIKTEDGYVHIVRY